MKNFIIIIFFVSFSCSTPTERPVVKSIGELRKIMHQGELQARVRLDSLVQSNTYGLGALDSLSGELLVIGGDVFKSFVEQDSLKTIRYQSANATLFVYSEISQWDTLQISRAVDVESTLGEATDQSTSFPFMLIGKPSLDYHIINFDADNGDFSNHKKGAFNGSFGDEEATILGFYSRDAKGVYTHHNSNLHMHVINANQKIMGHVDRIDLNGGNYKLLIPKQ